MAGLKGKQWVFKTLQRPESPTLVTGASNVSRSFGLKHMVEAPLLYMHICSI